MVKKVFLKLFPVPKYLRRPAAGLDISDRSIKAVTLKPVGENLILEKFVEQEVPTGVIDGGEIKDAVRLSEILKTIQQQIGSRFVIVSLPEERAFVARVSLPLVRRSQIRSSLELQLENYVPLAAPEAVFDYQVLPSGKTPAGVEVSVSVVPRELAEGYLTTLHRAGLTPLAFEIEAQAIVRAVVPRSLTQTLMVIDIGRTRTSFFVVKKGALLFTSTITSFGGDNLTLAVQKNLECSAAIAEQLKIEHGLLRSKKLPKLAFALLPLASVLKDEIFHRLDYWHTEGENAVGERIERVIICGGQATLPGLTEYLSAYLPVEVTLGNVWSNILDLNQTVPIITRNESQKFAAALGLALRHLIPFL